MFTSQENDKKAIESCNTRLAALEIGIDKIQKAILKQIVIKNEDLLKELTNCKNKLMLINSVLKDLNSESEEVAIIKNKFLSYKNVVKDLSFPVYKICLGDEMEEVVKENNRLNAHMKEICVESASVSLESQEYSNIKYEKERVKTNFLYLYATYKDNKKLLKKIQGNLKIEDSEFKAPKNKNI